MGRLTILDGIGEYDLRPCFGCSDGAGPNNENCGLCRHPHEAEQKLGELETLIEQGSMVRVVRCSQCKHYNIPCCTCLKLNISIGENGYCIHGTLK